MSMNQSTENSSNHLYIFSGEIKRKFWVKRNVCKNWDKKELATTTAFWQTQSLFCHYRENREKKTEGKRNCNEVFRSSSRKSLQTRWFQYYHHSLSTRVWGYKLYFCSTSISSRKQGQLFSTLFFSSFSIFFPNNGNQRERDYRVE